MSIDYVFFDEGLRDRFIDFVSRQGVATEVRRDAMAGYVVQLSEDIHDHLLALIEDAHDALMHEEIRLAQAEG
jgi:hypothetical protein